MNIDIINPNNEVTSTSTIIDNDTYVDFEVFIESGNIKIKWAHSLVKKQCEEIMSNLKSGKEFNFIGSRTLGEYWKIQSDKKTSCDIIFHFIDSEIIINFPIETMIELIEKHITEHNKYLC